jgi:hypothetical protein
MDSSFPRFVASLLFYFCQRAPQGQVFEPIVQRIHRILKVTNQGLPTPIVLIALFLYRKMSDIQKPIPGAEVFLFIVALIVAQKSHADNCYTMATWSKVAQVPLESLFRMEREFLHCIQFHVHVSDKEYSHWYACIQQLALKYEGSAKKSAQPSKLTINTTNIPTTAWSTSATLTA